MTILSTFLPELKASSLLFAFWLSLATCLFSVNLEKRSHGWLRAGVSMAAYMLFCVFVPRGKDGLLDVCSYICMIWVNGLVIMSYCRVSWAEAFQTALYACLTEHLASSVYILIFVSKWAALSAAYAVISLIVYGAVWLLFARKMVHNGHLYVRGSTTMLMNVLTVLVTVALSYLVKHNADPSGDMSFEVVGLRTMLQLSQWYAIAFCVVMLAIELSHQQQIQTQLDLAASHELLRVHDEQYRLTRDNIELINRKCHDMKHQVALLMEQQTGSEELRRRYGDEINKIIEVYDTNIDAGNEVLNTILRDKSLYCSMNGISWTCAAHGACLSFVDPMDLAAIIGNALDNAVEAVERIPDKNRQIISVQISSQCNMAQILVENTFDGKLNRVGSQLLTSKQDRNYHGIGIKSIIATAEKYGGYASANTEGNAFILNVLIPIPSEQKG